MFFNNSADFIATFLIITDCESANLLLERLNPVSAAQNAELRQFMVEFHESIQTSIDFYIYE